MTHLLNYKSVSLAEEEQRVIELTDRLRKQLWSTRKLSRLLDDTEKAAARLRSSRRWKLANPMTAIEAKLFPGKGSMGYGHLEKIVAAYAQWRALHPEIGKIKEEISALQNATISKYEGVDLGKTAQESQIVEPPVPVLPVESISFPTHEDVAVSIIIPVFNQFQYTHACLASLQTVGDKVAFEVIVVDDCSTDETTALVERMEGVIYLRNKTNSGFIASCNRGANKARGKYLFFLNNDTLVKEGWLTTLWIPSQRNQEQASSVRSLFSQMVVYRKQAGLYGEMPRDGTTASSMIQKNRSTIISGTSITVRQRRSWSQDRFSRRSGDLTKGMRLLITRTPIWRLRFARPATGCYTNH